MSIPIQPCETNPKLIVDPNTVLTPAISFKRFQPEAREPEIFERGRCIQKLQPDARGLFNRLKSSANCRPKSRETSLSRQERIICFIYYNIRIAVQ
ncbi:MAG TPA: hypothetical protein VMQ86_15810 [Bryobacteraceae bacterium]|nr:hypothetical protein [Bryobacteraceae bacterium]